MFDLSFFRSDPSVFYSFAKEIYPSQFRPSESHRFVRLLELKDKLLRNYSQSPHARACAVVEGSVAPGKLTPWPM